MTSNLSQSLTVFSQIDEGSFGQIYLVRKNGGCDDGKTYAMKTIRSNPAFAEQHKICCNELKMLKMMYGAPFIIQLKYAIKTRSDYNFVMNYMVAGNLFDYLQSGRLTLTETTICCAEIVLAIEYLHEHFIVYRDLKLENILISSDNHIVIADFGLARKLQDGDRLNDEAGTMAYFAPEMINSREGYSFEVDWWSLGIIAFELLVGHTPFLSSASENISDKVHRNRILREDPRLTKLRQIGKNVGKVTDMIEKLLVKDPQLRLGADRTGYKAVKQHPFFSQLNWNAVKLKKYPCLEQRSRDRSIEIDYNVRREISLEEPEEQRRKQFHYIAPEFRVHENEPFLGFTEQDFKELPIKIRIPPQIHDIQLNPILFIKTSAPAEVIKQMIMPKKTTKVVRFFDNPNDSVGPIRTPPSNADQRYNPYAKVYVNTGQPRRSDRVAAKRRTRSISIS